MSLFRRYWHDFRNLPDMTSKTAQPIAVGRDQHAVAAEFHALLDDAVNQINSAAEEGRLSPTAAAGLRGCEAALRYQIRQLRSASPAAANDLESGMWLSWSRLEARLRDSIVPSENTAEERIAHYGEEAEEAAQ